MVCVCYTQFLKSECNPWHICSFRVISRASLHPCVLVRDTTGGEPYHWLCSQWCTGLQQDHSVRERTEGGCRAGGGRVHDWRIQSWKWCVAFGNKCCVFSVSASVLLSLSLSLSLSVSFCPCLCLSRCLCLSVSVSVSLSLSLSLSPLHHLSPPPLSPSSLSFSLSLSFCQGEGWRRLPWRGWRSSWLMRPLVCGIWKWVLCFFYICLCFALSLSLSLSLSLRF